MAEQRAAVLLRLDPALKARLSAEARKNDRTVNSEASRILREHLDRALGPHLAGPEVRP